MFMNALTRVTIKYYVIVEFESGQSAISRRDHFDHVTTGSDIFDVLYFYHLNIIVICILYTWMVNVLHVYWL